MREWSLPNDISKGLDGRGWQWFALRCIHCQRNRIEIDRTVREEHRG
jgi:hypothetical protein